MAKVTNPLFSIEASGKFADTVVYQKWKGIDFARKFVKPTNANTSGQLQIRGYFKTAIAAWQAEQSAAKLAWNTYAKTNNLAMTGMNVYVGAYCKFLLLHSGTAPTVTNTPPNMS